MSPTPSSVAPSLTDTDYEQDLYQWALRNARLLREGRVMEIDAANIAEELEDMGRSERRSLKSHLRVLLIHLLKWQFQPTLRTPSWRLSIRNARDKIEEILEESPSLKGQVPNMVDAEYPKARRFASEETGMDKSIFPNPCPFTPIELMDEEFLPDG